ncbi:sodium/hydrogen exchanger 8 isoform X4 [Ursus americanus]|uniref:sodium/hydrogen exchanger 8 isoform X4 n=1 Tax=Ursus americanus TaxID=9643 RepID=UPI001E67C99F|nr:sodium/hydrogen exchanger 8 isoform X4 [Ursus americanus]
MGEKMAEEEPWAHSSEGGRPGAALRFPNTTHEGFNVTLHTTLVVTTKLVLPTPAKPILPVQTGEQAQQEEQSSGMTIFFSLLVLAICIILVHLLIRYRLHFLPESVAVVSLGILMGAVIKIIEFKKLANWKEEEMFRPNMFFLLLLPPIIFESGYSLHKLCVWLPDFCRRSRGHYCYFQRTSRGPGAQHAGFWGEYSQRRSLHCPDQHIDLRKTPSLEFGMMIIFAYLPYGLAEGTSLSGIMAILFSGIVMSHYTHHNLSPVTQILMQQTLRTVAFLCETCVFAFLGLSIFSFPHKFEISFVIWCIVLVLFGRAVNIFPLSYLLNFFRDHKITPKMMFIMWFSGLRGAIPYALSLHLDLEPMEKRQLIGTTTIIIVLFTILLLGGSTMPLIRLMDIEDAKARRRNKKDVNLSKTEKMGNTIESEHLSELTEEEYEAHYIRRQDLKGFVWLDAKYLNPFFTRRLTQEDLHHGRIQMKTLTNKWYEEVRQGPSGSEDDEQELL